MQNLDLDEAETRLSTMTEYWREARNDELGPNGERHVFHVEFGHYSNTDHFKLFEHYAVRNADSVGMNEVELAMLLDYWSDDFDDINEEKSSQPSLEIVLQHTR